MVGAVLTREYLIDLLAQMLAASHDGSVTMRVPQGVAILNPSGKHFLIRVTEATLEPA